jgi:protein-tyrosine phosphatase
MKPRSYDPRGAGQTTVLSVSPRVGSTRRKLDDDDPQANPGSESFTVGASASASVLRRRRTNIRGNKKAGLQQRRVGMDITWLTDRVAVGGGIWTADNMAAVSRAGITHVINMQVEFDDTPLAVPHGIKVCWNPIDDDFEPKPPEVFARGVEFALAALENNDAKLFVHCAAGVHRSPMMALALLAVMGWTVEDAMDLIEMRRPVADFAGVYVRSVENFLSGRG